MGCDIHGWVEIKDGEKWIAVKPLKDDSRNYRRFTLLAGVRRDKNKYCKAKPKGIPKDVSETTHWHIKEWGEDGHSHSYLPLGEAVEIFLKTDCKSEYAEKHPAEHFFGVRDNCVEEYRLVFWFDN
jgi:hypothetical protein